MYRFIAATLLAVSSIYAQLTDTTMQLTVVKCLKGSLTTFQYDVISDDSYTTPDTVKQYRFSFNTEFDTITVIAADAMPFDEPYIGVIDSVYAERFNDTFPTLTYNLVYGTFAGGAVRIFTQTDPPTAEVRIFGSGLPIIVSDVGTLGSSTALVERPSSGGMITGKTGNTGNGTRWYLPNGQTLKNKPIGTFSGKKRSNTGVILPGM